MSEYETKMLTWYQFEKGKSVCHIINQRDLEKVMENIIVYHYIVVLGEALPLENEAEKKSLQKLTEHLEEEGKILLLAKNKLAIRNFAKTEFNGKTKQQWIERLNLVGFNKIKIYYPFPDIEFTQLVYTDERLITENDLWRLMNYYSEVEKLMFKEYDLHGELIKNKMFPQMNNVFLFEGTRNGELSRQNFVTITPFRRRKYAFATLLYDDKVIKKPLYEEGQQQCQQIIKNTKELKVRGINVVNVEHIDGELVMDYVDKQMLHGVLENRLEEKDIIRIFDQLWEIILSSSEIVPDYRNVLLERCPKDLNYGPILKRAYIELIPLNAFWDNGEMLFFDQEFEYDNYPALFILFRGLRNTPTITTDIDLLEKLKKRYGLIELWDLFRKIDDENWNSWYRFEQRETSIDRGMNHKIIEYHNMFAREFFVGESDFLLFERLKMTKQLSLDLLKVVEQICMKRNLKYYPLFGTLLGAIRHQGFIPWDDDVDLGMLREDYEEFINECSIGLPKGYELYVPSASESFFNGGYIRLINSNTTAIEVKNYGCGGRDGFWIDIMPLDLCYQEEEKNKKKLQMIRDIQAEIKRRLYDGVEKDKETSELSVSLEFLQPLELVELYQKMNQVACKGDKDSSSVGIFLRNQAEDYLEIKNEELEFGRKMNYEGVWIDIPRGYHQILTQSYGRSYMEYPPLNKRYPKHDYFFKPNVSYLNYHRRFYDWKQATQGKEVILFGAGYMVLNFLANHGRKRLVKFIVDNDKKKWGKELRQIDFPKLTIELEYQQDDKVLATEMGNIQINSPKKLLEPQGQGVSIIICSTAFEVIEKQIRSMGIKENYYIYVQDPEWLLN